MIWSCPQYIEDAMWRSAKKKLSENALKRQRLLQSIVDRTLLYTTERDELSLPKMHEDGDVAARALFFALADLPKLLYVLDELSPALKLEGKEELKVLDLGSGAGTLTFALAHHFRDSNLTIESTLVEREMKMSSLSEETFRCLGETWNHLKCQFVSQDLRQFPLRSKYDFVLLGTVLNELDEDTQKQILKSAMESLNDNGFVIVTEPALKTPSRQLHALRDWIVSECGGHVYAPCTHSNPQCPMLLGKRDWCHEDLRSVHPEITQQLSQATGLRDNGLKFSYLVVQNHKANCADALVSPIRVVSRPQKNKVGNTFWGCGPSGLARFRLVKKERNSKNKILGKLKRGETFSLSRASLSGTKEGETVDVLASDVVTTE